MLFQALLDYVSSSRMNKSEGGKGVRYIIQQNLPPKKKRVSLLDHLITSPMLHTEWANKFIPLLFLQLSLPSSGKDTTISIHSFSSYELFCSSPFPPLPICLPLPVTIYLYTSVIHRPHKVTEHNHFYVLVCLNLWKCSLQSLSGGFIC